MFHFFSSHRQCFFQVFTSRTMLLFVEEGNMYTKKNLDNGLSIEHVTD